MDRIDIRIDVRRIAPRAVLETGSGTNSDELKESVLRARDYASWRRTRTGCDEREREAPSLVKSSKLSEGNREFFERVALANGMSGRALIRTLAVARTIADMEEESSVGKRHLCEAIGLRLREGLET